MGYVISDSHPSTDLPNRIDIETIAERAHVKLSYATARCAHGYTRDQTCIDCEYGYSTDGHQYANLRSEPIFAYFGDDGTYVAYIRHTPDNIRKLARAGYAP